MPQNYDERIEEITTDAHGRYEQLSAFAEAFSNEVPVPCDATVLGEPVRVLAFDFDGNARRGLTAKYRRADGSKHEAAAADVLPPARSAAARYITAYESGWA